jgi:hypothetical protein
LPVRRAVAQLPLGHYLLPDPDDYPAALPLSGEGILCYNSPFGP